MSKSSVNIVGRQAVKIPMKDVSLAVSKYSNHLGDNDRGFVKRVFSTDQSIYIDRLRAIGFQKYGRVLDAGCGFGQWSLALSALNNQIDAVDISNVRVNFLKHLSQAFGSKIDIVHAHLSDLPYADDTFDALFCYGVIFSTDYKKTLSEFSRVLKPGGRVYLTANGLGFHIYLWKEQPNRAIDYDPREVAAMSFANTIAYEKEDIPPVKGQIIIESDEMQEAMEGEGLQIIEKGPEGSINLYPGEIDPQSFFRGTYYGLECCYELLAQLNKM